MTRSVILTTLLIVAFLGQLAFGYRISGVRPPWEVLPPTPSPAALEASAFGDKEFLYRVLVLDLQNFGDTGGHSTRMADYDMPRVVDWLKVLDSLDVDANHHMMLATQYFVFTQDLTKLDDLIRYVQEEVPLSPARHWRWLLEAVYIAQMKRHNLPWALELAKQLSSYDYPDMPIIARQMGAFMSERTGDYAGAAAIMSRVLAAHEKDALPGEADFMRDFIESMNQRAAGAPRENERGLLPSLP